MQAAASCIQILIISGCLQRVLVPRSVLIITKVAILILSHLSSGFGKHALRRLLMESVLAYHLIARKIAMARNHWMLSLSLQYKILPLYLHKIHVLG